MLLLKKINRCNSETHYTSCKNITFLTSMHLSTIFIFNYIKIDQNLKCFYQYNQLKINILPLKNNGRTRN